MSFNSKFAALALTAIVAAGALATSTQAQAKGPGPAFGVAAGLFGAAVVGSAIAAGSPYYVAGYRHCVWVPQYNYYGAYIGRVRACD
ncbi:hypothetical protein SR870_17505 [Rhodopseudomonas palustris]|uniref:hypothetical protein n=1 Tax=Rhodopseudomonas TaxID=1073 RepID=UPI002ACEAF41|nr:hypothetical protein [Rhodopseudomonas palustris]WQG98487.1 hypothetical protein SR870_17505 [Rhodopseudomonas palustris]